MLALQQAPPPAPAARDTARPALQAIRLTAAHPAIDGRLDEAVWKEGAAATRFTQVVPRDGSAPSERTEVRVAYDGDALYVGARLHDSRPDGIVARLGRRDAETNSDNFAIIVDSYHDHRTAYRFEVNPANVRRDNVSTGDTQNGDASWDPVWESAARVDSAGWTVEMRIPLSQLRFSSAAEQTWGVDFERSIVRSAELARWSWAPNSETGFASRFGHLTGLRDVAAARSHRAELMPYAVMQGDFATGTDPANPFNPDRRGRASFGADFRYGLSSGLSLAGTINPDFGQVDADPAEVNLTVFETQFQERRPFFVEGANLFTYPTSVFAAPLLFYSRRVGRAPSGGVPSDARFVDRPDVTTILGAAKLSGKVGAWSLGLMTAVTDREDAAVILPSLRRQEVAIEPRASYTVLGLQRDFRRGASGVGFLGTGVVRQIDTTSLAFLRTSAFAGGIDFFHRFARNQYSINGTISGSMIRGDSVAIIAAQRSSARYYQRPDQDYAPFDPGARSMSGYNVSLSGGKVAGTWLFGSDFFASSPGFEINDAGFQQSTDRIFHGMRLTRRWLQPTKRFRQAQAYVNVSHQYNFGGTRISAGLFSGVFAQFHNRWSVSLNGTLSPDILSDRLTRGGPLEVVPRQYNVNGNVNTDPSRAVTGSAGGNYSRNAEGGYGGSAFMQVGIRPTAALNVTLTPSYGQTNSIAGYVGAPVDPTATAMYGRRYIVANLLQRTLDLTARANMSLTSALSVQLYTQPFASTVAYTGYKAWVRPETFEFLVYGRDNGSTIAYDEARRLFRADPDGPGPAPAASFANPDFRLRSLRTNLVVRWEYRPGSTLFVAWAHGREGFNVDPSFDAGRDLRDLFRDDQRNRLLIKASYWFNP